MLAAINARAQWVQTNGPHGGYIKCTTVSGTNIFAAGGGLYRSSNNGANWEGLNYGPSTSINCIVVNGTQIFIGTGEGVYLSTNNGET